MDSSLAVKQLLALKKSVRGKRLRLAAEWPKRWQVLISTILSPQTKDEVTIAVCEKLFADFPSLEKLGNISLEDLEKRLSRVNYYKTKARHVKQACELLAGEEIPETLERLIELPGVGRKVANVYLAVALSKPAIAVDTHVARISQKLGWSKHKQPHKIEKDLEVLFPRRYWRDINEVLVTFGRTIGRSKEEEEKVLARLINQTLLSR